MQGTILYIEDDLRNRILVKRVLEAEGYTIHEAENGTSGIAAAQQLKPDLILMDINLPDIDGYEATRQLREMEDFAQVPIVALTANAMLGDEEKALAAGCTGYISKPIDIDEITGQIGRFIKMRSGEDQTA